MSAYKKPVSKKCDLCGKAVFSNKSKYCRRCSKFALRVKNKRLPPETVKAIFEYVRTYGFMCFYTGMSLNMDDPDSPWHLEFDHWMPADPSKIVLTSRLLNEMKNDLTEVEFKYYIIELDNHKKKGTRVRKKSLKFWYRLHPPSQLDLSLPQTVVTERIHKKCTQCGKMFWAHWNTQKYCPRCDKFTMQMEYDKLPPHVIKQIWRYVRKHGFVCYYTGVRLDRLNPHNPWYISYDHCTPHNDRKVVLTTRLFNAIKTELSEKEFWYMVSQLAAHFKNGTPVRKIKLKYWTGPKPYER